jgi:hypothetical protein
MIPPCPLQFALWGSALYTELATGLWRALASPWLEPGSPGPIRTADHSPTEEARARPAVAAVSDEPFEARSDPVANASPGAQAFEGRVIEVSRARWPGRRATGGSLSESG